MFQLIQPGRTNKVISFGCPNVFGELFLCFGLVLFCFTAEQWNGFNLIQNVQYEGLPVVKKTKVRFISSQELSLCLT